MLPVVKNAPKLIDENERKTKKKLRSVVVQPNTRNSKNKQSSLTGSVQSNVPTSRSTKKIAVQVDSSPTISELLAKKSENGNNVTENVSHYATNQKSNAPIVKPSGNGKTNKDLVAVPSSAGGLRVKIRRNKSNRSTSTPTSSRRMQKPDVNINNGSDTDSNASVADSDSFDGLKSNASDADTDSGDSVETDVTDNGDMVSCSSDELSDSGDEVSDDDDIDETEIRKEAQDKKWKFEATLESKVAVDEFLSKESWWSFRTKNECSDGVKILYRCNRVKRTSKIQCEAGIYIVKSENFDGVSDAGSIVSYKLYRKNALHTHNRSPEYKQKVTDRVKNMIIEQYKNGRKPKSISYSLLDDSSLTKKEKPTYRQIIQIITNFKNNGSGSKPLTMRKLTEFVKQHMILPNGDDEAFIVKFERSPKGQQREKFFRFFISTKRLLRNAATATTIHADSTHKVTTEKVPLIAAGVTDFNSKFHFAGLTLSNHERYEDYEITFEGLRKGVEVVTKLKLEPEALVCDGDTAIHKGYNLVFGRDAENGQQERKHIIIMCYFHVMLNIRKKYKFKKSSNRNLFKADVRKLHLSPSEAIFNNGCKLFVTKWRKAEPQATRLMKKSFFENFKSWYIGAADRVPKHNNGVENFNSTMKRCQTEHRRQPLKIFLNTALAIVRQRSLEYLKDKAQFANEISICDKMLKQGVELNLQYISNPVNVDGSIDFYALSSTLKRPITPEDIQLYENPSHKTFDDFASNGLNIRKITFPKNSSEWKLANCSCYTFDHSFMCIHIISIASSLGLIADTEPEAADFDDEPLFRTRRGRPKNTSKAMIKE